MQKIESQFIYKPKGSDCDISQLEAHVESLKSTVAEMNVKIENFEKGLKTVKLLKWKPPMCQLKILSVIKRSNYEKAYEY